MFDPSKYKSYRGHCQMYYINEKATISDVRAACPLFFENARKGEKRTMYRGHLIVKFIETYSSGQATRIVIYAWDVRKKDTHAIDVDVKPCDIQEAKRIIDAKLDTPVENPLKLSVSTETMNVPVEVKFVIFREADGTVANIELDEWRKVGATEADERHPVDLATALYSYVDQQARHSILRTRTK